MLGGCGLLFLLRGSRLVGWLGGGRGFVLRGLEGRGGCTDSVSRLYM